MNKRIEFQISVGWLALSFAALVAVWFVVPTAGLVRGQEGDKKGAVKSKFDWPDLPSEGQVRKVFVTRIRADVDKDHEVANAEVVIEAGDRAKRVLSKAPQTKTPPEGNDQVARIRMRINFEELARDWRKYATDAEKSERIVRYRARAQQSFSLKPPTFGKLDFGAGFKTGKQIELKPWYRGTPEDAITDRQKLIDQSLMIIDPKVVDNDRAKGNGKWSFGYLMTQMANEKATGIRPAEFVRNWLRHWEENQIINGEVVPHRQVGVRKFMDGWPKTEKGELDLDKAPFRLLAIVSRLDLRNNLVLGAKRIGGGGAGEARFVYCALDKDTKPMPFTVIFEYAIKKPDFENVRHWARQWYELQYEKLGSKEYNAALEVLTEQFAAVGQDPESPPNGSALAQLRTNEISLDLDEPANGRGPVWEIREFRLGIPTDGHLKQVTVQQTPNIKYDDTQRLADFVNGQEKAILDRSHQVPIAFPAGRPFLDGASLTPLNQFWKVNPAPKAAPPIKSGEARHLFSLATCSGCHAAETFKKLPATFGGDPLDKDQVPPMFTHVRPRQAGKASRLSPFLTGVGNDDFYLEDPAGQKDPAGKVVRRAFGDLRRRANDLHDLVQYGWFYELHRLPIQFVH